MVTSQVFPSPVNHFKAKSPSMYEENIMFNYILNIFNNNDFLYREIKFL
jgi:hypothetical protein